MSDAAPGQLTRQELYDKIRESSKDEYILAEMKRLGFWKEDKDKPSVPEAVIQRRGELQRQLHDLVKKQRLYSDPDAALKALRKERMEAAKEKRAETRKRHAEARYNKALDWHNKQQLEISWLGEAVSLGLSKKENNTETLTEKQLPVFEDHLALADAMGITLNELRFLAYQRKTSKISHYQHFQIVKKSGGYRQISAPMPRLKRVQYWILDNIFHPITIHPAAHGFVNGRSIISNAEPHVGKDLVINLDLQNFFPTISYRRVKGLLHKLGYSESLATVLALLCTEADVDQLDLDGERWFVQQGERHLPQGAPTSPTISNLICRSLDIRLEGLAERYGFTYTRYADDLTFSCQAESRNNFQKVLWGVRNIVKAEGFVLHPNKTRIMPKGSHQEVTGLVVNDRLSVDRKTLRRFRATLYQIEKNGLSGQSWNGISEPEKLLRSLLGYANFVAMVLPEKGAKFKQQAKAIYKKYAKQTETPFTGKKQNKAMFRARSAEGSAPYEGWKEASVKEPPQYEKTADELKAERDAVLAERRAERHREQQEELLEAQSRASRDNTSRRRGGFSMFARREREIRGEESSYDQNDWDDDDEDINLPMELYSLSSLDKCNEELHENQDILKTLSPIRVILSAIKKDKSKPIQRVGLIYQKLEMLIGNQDFSDQHIDDIAATAEDLEEFEYLSKAFYKQSRRNSVKTFNFYLFVAAIVFVLFKSPLIAVFCALIGGWYMLSGMIEYNRKASVIDRWVSAARQHLTNIINNPDNNPEEPSTVSDSTRQLSDAVQLNQHMVKNDEDWAIKFYDFVMKLLKRK